MWLKTHRLTVSLPGEDTHEIPLSGLEYDTCGTNDSEVLVLVGLARPFSRFGAFNTARCYLLALNILTSEQ